jgi:drug/metabolite transporter (DMT)-like permease
MSSKALFVIASLIWGSTFWAITLQLGEVSPYVSIVYRFGLASLILFAWCFLRGDRLRLPWSLQRWLMLQGFTTFSICYACTYASEQYLVSALVAVMFSLMVIWSPIAERIFFGVGLTIRIWCAALLSISGVVLLFSPALLAAWGAAPNVRNTHFGLGLGLALMATLSSTVGNVIVVKLRKQSGNVYLTMAWAMFWGTLWVALAILISGQSWRMPNTPSYWLSLLYLSVFGSVIAFAAYFILIARIGTQKTVYIGVITPIISLMLSIRFEHYRPGPLEWLGVVLCLSGVVWALKGKTPPASVPINPVNNLELI